MPNKRLSWELITEKARRKPVRVAIGVESRVEEIIHLAESACSQGFGEVVVVSATEQNTQMEQVQSDDPCTCLVEMLKNGDVQGVVRGSLPSNTCMNAVKKGFGVSKLYRAAFLQTSSAEHTFLVVPVGVDEGTTLEDVIEAGKMAVDLLTKVEVAPRVGVLSCGREEDRDRNPLIGTSLDDASKICAWFEKNGVPCENCQILIEDAIQTCNVILPPNGVMGNLIFRTLCLLGGGIGFGAPVLNIPGVYVDTSRESFSYERAIALTSVLQ